MPVRESESTVKEEEMKTAEVRRRKTSEPGQTLNIHTFGLDPD